MNAKSDFDKNLFKLLNNAVYGKTMENIDKRKQIKIVNSWESEGKRLGAGALIAKPNFHSLKVFDDTMISIQLNRDQVKYNKPMYVGFTVLELSKRHMFKFHYDYMKPKYMDKITLNYMDTDSFIYTIETDDFYADIKNDIHEKFDTSGYPKNNIFRFPLLNEKALGMMKDEVNGNIVLEFVGLMSKLYSLKVMMNDKEDLEIKKAKGVKRSCLSKLNISDYRKCLLENKVYTDNMYIFRSRLHNIYTEQLNKIILRNSDDKRHICENGIDTYAWKHYKIRNQ